MPENLWNRNPAHRRVFQQDAITIVSRLNFPPFRSGVETERIAEWLSNVPDQSAEDYYYWRSCLCTVISALLRKRLQPLTGGTFALAEALYNQR